MIKAVRIHTLEDIIAETYSTLDRKKGMLHSIYFNVYTDLYFPHNLDSRVIDEIRTATYRKIISAKPPYIKITIKTKVPFIYDLEELNEDINKHITQGDFYGMSDAGVIRPGLREIPCFFLKSDFKVLEYPIKQQEDRDYIDFIEYFVRERRSKFKDSLN